MVFGYFSKVARGGELLAMQAVLGNDHHLNLPNSLFLERYPLVVPVSAFCQMHAPFIVLGIVIILITHLSRCVKQFAFLCSLGYSPLSPTGLLFSVRCRLVISFAEIKQSGEANPQNHNSQGMGSIHYTWLRNPPSHAQTASRSLNLGWFGVASAAAASAPLCATSGCAARASARRPTKD